MRLVAVPDDEELKTRLYLLANMHNVTFVDGSAK
jgi:prepilin-type processing-associated H-X9-DG protein